MGRAGGTARRGGGGVRRDIAGEKDASGRLVAIRIDTVGNARRGQIGSVY